MFGLQVPSERDRVHMFAFRKPIGVVGLITPWNFPIAIPAWKLAPALICGNTVIMKPASVSPLCSWRLVEALHEAGIPKGVVNYIAWRMHHLDLAATAKGETYSEKWHSDGYRTDLYKVFVFLNDVMREDGGTMVADRDATRAACRAGYRRGVRRAVASPTFRGQSG